jgi:cytochrome c556
MRSTLLAFAIAAAAALASCTPVLNTPIEEIPKLATLKEVMHNQATSADKLWPKIGEEATYTDADYAAFAETGKRVGATSLKIKDFTKGPEFDALAMRLNEKSTALATAAAAKDAAGSGAALKDMKATCKECHSKFR